MLTYLRYALATICFALSVACVYWWHSSVTGCDYYPGPWEIGGYTVEGESGGGVLMVTARQPVSVIDTFTVPLIPTDQLQMATKRWRLARLNHAIERSGYFGAHLSVVHFPLWYPALVFALAGVGTLRLGRRFTLRSAIIATTVVAGLLGMVVAL